jgi:hypothetical protein
MSKELMTDQKKQIRRREPVAQGMEKQRPTGLSPETAAVLRLQRTAGNRAVQRLLAQRQSSADGFDLDDATAGRIDRARGGGQPLDGVLQQQMGDHMGYDFSEVRVHTGPESDALNQQLSARAFTTGQDIFLRSSDYSPGSSSGRELIAHELSHVVQQGTGRVTGSGSGMTVRPAGDAFEQEADALARQATHASPAASAQPDGGGIQRQGLPEEEEIQTKALQRQEIPEEEELGM